MTIGALDSSDFAAWLALRLRMLHDHPDAFGSSPTDSIAADRSAAHARFVSACGEADNRIMGALADGDLIGTCGVQRHSGEKSRHRMDIWGMYVTPDHRGTGVGTRLIRAAIQHARQTDGVLQIHLAVSSHNVAAITTYARLGFQRYGREPRSLRLPDRFVDEDLMVLLLDAAPAR